eukprot:Skav231410  [mRNA]  locus=scaffold4039:88511:94417:- [translate_table: standard]
MAGRAGAVVGARRRARSRARHAGRGYDRTRPPVYLSQQRVPNHPNDRFQALAPVTVSAFLEGYGYETRADADMWLVRPGVGGATPTLTFDVSGHEERGGVIRPPCKGPNGMEEPEATKAPADESELAEIEISLSE